MGRVECQDLSCQQLLQLMYLHTLHSKEGLHHTSLMLCHTLQHLPTHPTNLLPASHKTRTQDIQLSLHHIQTINSNLYILLKNKDHQGIILSKKHHQDTLLNNKLHQDILLNNKHNQDTLSNNKLHQDILFNNNHHQDILFTNKYRIPLNIRHHQGILLTNKVTNHRVKDHQQTVKEDWVM